MKRFVAGLLATAAAAYPACSHANLLVNSGFEDGTYSSSVPAQGIFPAHTDDNVPDGWTPDAGFADPFSANGVVEADPHSGAAALQIGNRWSDPLATISQGFQTTAGQSYMVEFYLRLDGPFNTLTARIDGASYLSISTGQDPYEYVTTLADGTTYTTHTHNYISEDFTVYGTGSDDLTFSDATAGGYAMLDDVSVAPVPEPASWQMLMVGGLAVTGALALRRRGGRA